MGLTPWGGDSDTVAAHSVVMQIGAETGWVGVALFAALCIWSVVYLKDSPPADAVIAATTVAVLLVHAQVDHVLDFGPVVLALGIVLGWAHTRHTLPLRCPGRSGSAMLRGHR